MTDVGTENIEPIAGGSAARAAVVRGKAVDFHKAMLAEGRKQKEDALLTVQDLVSSLDEEDFAAQVAMEARELGREVAGVAGMVGVLRRWSTNRKNVNIFLY